MTENMDQADILELAGDIEKAQLCLLREIIRLLVKINDRDNE